MIIRKLAVAAAATAVAFAGTTSGAGADSPLADWVKPFEAGGTIYNDSPPLRLGNTDYRFYFDGDNFSINPVSYATPRAAKNIDGSGTLGIKTSPTTEYYLNGEPTDFFGAIIEGCTVDVEGNVTNIPTLIGRDDLRATKVSTTC